MALVALAGDIIAVAGAIVFWSASGWWMGEGALWPKALVVAVSLIVPLHLVGLYSVANRMGRTELAVRLFVAICSGMLVAAALGFAVPAARFRRLAFLEIYGVLAPSLLAWRLLWHQVIPNDRFRRRVLVLGVSDAAASVVTLQGEGARAYTVLGFLDDAPDAADRVPPHYDLLGKSRDLLNLADELHPDVVLVTLPDMRGTLPITDLLECRLRGIRVEDWPTFYERHTGKVLVSGLRPSWLIFSDGFVKTNLTRAAKRVLDVVFALLGLIVLAPILALVAVAIRLESRGPVLFSQDRVGQGARIFTLHKFRSMRVGAEETSGAVWATPRDPRVTRVGRLLRRTRLDEVPQLVNVLKGEMSFVGPRPERPEFVRTLQRQLPFYMERLCAKPGVTGWAQVRYQYAASLEDSLEKLQYDLYYVKNVSLFLDLLIVFSTVQVVLLSRGAR